MKRIQAVNGYTIYQATERDTNKYNVIPGSYYIYFSSDVRDFGIANSEPDWEADTLETALEWCTSSNYAIAKEMVEATTTAATFEEIAEVEKQLDAGISADEIYGDDDDSEDVYVITESGLFYVRIDNSGLFTDHGPYFTKTGAENAAEIYKNKKNI